MSLIIGIDPGLTGAVGILNADGSYHCLFDLPVIRDLSLAWIDGKELTSGIMRAVDGQPARIMVERVSAMPKQGLASTFCFGVGFGSILGALRVLSHSIEFVTPGTWKKAIGIGPDKKAAMHKARLLFPVADLSLAKHHGRAEALLIAHHALRRQRGMPGADHGA